MQPLTLRSFARAILHIDADAFFASCEQAVNPGLKGKPVVTGKERGIASAVSYEAKARGVKRGMTIREIREICPDAIHLPSDYETYSLFSQRMFAIVRRYTPDVEEYSVDECFCDLTGLRRPLRMSYETMAARIKADLEHDLGLTFAVGLAPTKVVAKLASKWQKPAGLTVISGNDLHLYLDQVPIGNVWGIGEQTTAYLTRFGIATALDFARQEELCGGYFGEATPALLARMRLQMIMSDVGWTLWAAIQARISTIDYDFWGWALERWERARGMVGDPDFEGWLEAVRLGGR